MKTKKDSVQRNQQRGRVEQEAVLRNKKGLLFRIMERLIPSKQEYQATFERATKEKNRWTEMPYGWKTINPDLEMTDEEKDMFEYIPELQNKLLFYEWHRQKIRETREACLRLVLHRFRYKVLKPIGMRFQAFLKHKGR